MFFLLKINDSNDRSNGKENLAKKQRKLTMFRLAMGQQRLQSAS